MLDGSAGRTPEGIPTGAAVLEFGPNATSHDLVTGLKWSRENSAND